MRSAAGSADTGDFNLLFERLAELKTALSAHDTIFSALASSRRWPADVIELLVSELEPLMLHRVRAFDRGEDRFSL